jgi:hypothetical protein
MPVGYAAGAAAYREAAMGLTAADLTDHYTAGMHWLREVFAPALKARLTALSGGVWDLDDYAVWAAGSDTDFLTLLLEALCAREEVALYPGDWWGFVVGGTWDERAIWTRESAGRPAAICVPSVRNGHLTGQMLDFLEGASGCVLNINLYPTLAPAERRAVALALAPVLPKSVVSVSFSRGFGLTASQLGVALVHRDHPWNQRFARQWGWSTYFHNALAARAFLAVDLEALGEVDRARRAWVRDQLLSVGLPAVESGSYYVKSFRPVGPVPEGLAPLHRGDVVRFCFKPPQV